jgi:hypothetical protein
MYYLFSYSVTYGVKLVLLYCCTCTCKGKVASVLNQAKNTMKINGDLHALSTVPTRERDFAVHGYDRTL